AVRVLVIAAVVAALGGSGTASPSTSGIGLKTAVFDPIAFATTSDTSTAYAHVVAAGASAVRIYVSLYDIAPVGDVKPPSFDPATPADPGYAWSSVDDQITKAVAAGLEPILCLGGMPTWGTDRTPNGVARPSSYWYGKF